MPVLKIKNNGVWEQVSGIPDHTHVINDITDFPTSLPANGGNADTVDGKHASDFASAAEMTTVQNDINDINTVLNGIDIPTTLPNPKAITFTGAANASYDGSSEVNVEIPLAYGATETAIFSIDSVTFVDNEDGKMEASIDMPMPFTEAGIYKVKIGNRSGIAGILQKDIDDWNDIYKEYGEYIDIDLCDIFRDEKNLNESFPDGFYYNNTTLTLYDDSIEAGEYPVSITKVDAYPSIKMDKVNPTAIGSFSLNRKPGSTIGAYSHAEGQSTTASGSYSHTEGAYTTASASCSHAEGSNTTASGEASHAEGYITTASGKNSHAEGQVTTAKSENQHVQGKYNIEDSSGVYADIIGNGIASKRSNAATVDWSGNAWYAGDVYVGSTSSTNKDEGSKKLATEEYVDNSTANIEIPTTLPNPQSLTFTGAVTGSYDGSVPLTVEIPRGDSIVPAPSSADNGKYLGCENGKAKWMPAEASGGGGEWELLEDVEITEEVAIIRVTNLKKNYTEILCIVDDLIATTNTYMANVVVNGISINSSAFRTFKDNDNSNYKKNNWCHCVLYNGYCLCYCANDAGSENSAQPCRVSRGATYIGNFETFEIRSAHRTANFKSGKIKIYAR